MNIGRTLYFTPMGIGAITLSHLCGADCQTGEVL